MTMVTVERASWERAEEVRSLLAAFARAVGEPPPDAEAWRRIAAAAQRDEIRFYLAHDSAVFAAEVGVSAAPHTRKRSSPGRSTPTSALCAAAGSRRAYSLIAVTTTSWGTRSGTTPFLRPVF